MFPIGDENERGHGPAFVSLAFIGLNIAVFLLLQGAGGPSGEEFTYGYAAVPFEITNGVDLVDPEPITVDGQEQLEVPQEPGPQPDLADAAVEHVHARRLAPPRRQHAVPVDLRRQRRAPHRPHPVPRSSTSSPGVIASFAQILVNTDSIIPTLGASGAISGVLGAYLVMFPTNRVTVLMLRFPMQVPAIVAIGLWALLQFVSGFGQFGTAEEGGGVAYMAHIGGFVAGRGGRPRVPGDLPRAATSAGRARIGLRMSRRTARRRPVSSGPGSLAWRIDREVMVLAGGSCALLMQAAHPVVAAGVFEHSTYATDPFGRLRRTLEHQLRRGLRDPIPRRGGHPPRQRHPRALSAGIVTTTSRHTPRSTPRHCCGCTPP